MPVEQDFTVVQGDPWTVGLPCFNPLTNLPADLSGYGADFSVSQNFGDTTPLIYFTATTPTQNGSSISIQPYTGSPGTGTICVVTPNVRAADTKLVVGTVINQGAKTTRLWIHCRVIPPGLDPITILTGAWYLRTKA